MNWRPIRGWTKLLHERGMKADSMPERLLIGPGSPPSLDPVYPELSPPLEPCPFLIARRLKGVKRLKTQADEGLTPADEAGYVVLRQPPASNLANLFRIDALGGNPSGPLPGYKIFLSS